jgi:uncharacterized protein YrrD
MEFRQNASVYTVDGKDVGRVDRVVLNPETKEVTHIVVRKGFLFTEDKVIPKNLISVATTDKVMLREDVGDLHALPLFEETHYIWLSDGSPTKTDGDNRIGLAPPIYPYAGVGSILPASMTDLSTPQYFAETAQNIPEGMVALREGAKVIAADGQYVGNVEQVITDPQLGRVVRLVIAQGLLLKERRQIPITWVSQVQEDEVHLAVGSLTIDELGLVAN